jgi:O-antigen ligase
MMQRLLKNKWQEQWITGLLVLLFVGLLVSRALVSFASVLMIVPFFFRYREIVMDKKLIWAMGLIFLPLILSVFWSDDKTLWWNAVSVKLPLLTMMLGLISVPISAEKWKQIVFLFVLIISAGCVWSFWQYIGNYTAIHEGYLQAKVLPTPADNDHIRFSWMVVTAILLGIRYAVNTTLGKTKFLILFLLFFLLVYLHILAAKTGLVTLYSACFLYVLYIIFIQKKWKLGLGLVAIVFGVAMLCYYTMPTLRNRVQYVIYDFSHYSKGNTLPGYNDAARWQSIRAGYTITKENPLTGVGFGDMLNTIDQWHEKNHPESLPYERFLPANEWLVYGTGSGFPGLVCFTIGFLLLLYRTTSKNAGSVILSAISLVPFLIDDTLEGQYGVTVLAFIVFFGQQKLSEPATNT